METRFNPYQAGTVQSLGEHDKGLASSGKTLLGYDIQTGPEQCVGTSQAKVVQQIPGAENVRVRQAGEEHSRQPVE